MGNKEFDYALPFVPDKAVETMQSSWSDVRVFNHNSLTQNIDMVFTFCPLYAQGSLGESTLLTHSTSIEESRVGGKWLAIQKVIGGLHDYLSCVNGSLSVTAVLANKGILFNGIPNEEDYSALDSHALLYKQALDFTFSAKGIPTSFYTYDDFDVDFDRFVNPNAHIPGYERDFSQKADYEMLGLVNEFLHSRHLPEVTPNKKNRRPLKKMIDAFGFNATYWLVTGYLAFDCLLPDILGEHGVYMSVERFNDLFKIAQFTDGLNKKPRIEVFA